MQVPRHWRMKQQLYQLTGVRLANGEAGMLNRPDNTATEAPQEDQTRVMPAAEKTRDVRVA